MEAKQEELVDFEKYNSICDDQNEVTKFEIVYKQGQIPFQITVSIFRTKNFYKTLSEARLDVFRTLTYYRSVDQKFQ